MYSTVNLCTVLPTAEGRKRLSLSTDEPRIRTTFLQIRGEFPEPAPRF